MNRLYRRHHFLTKTEIAELISNNGVNLESSKSELNAYKVIEKRVRKQDDDRHLFGLILINELTDRIPEFRYSNLLIGTVNPKVYDQYSKEDYNIVLFKSTNKTMLCELGELIKTIDFIREYKYLFVMEPNVEYLFDEERINKEEGVDFVVPHKLLLSNQGSFIRNNIKHLCLNQKEYYQIMDDNRNPKDIFYEISRPFRYIHSTVSLYGKMSLFLSTIFYHFNFDFTQSFYYSILLEHKLYRFIDPTVFSYHDQISAKSSEMEISYVS